MFYVFWKAICTARTSALYSLVCWTLVCWTLVCWPSWSFILISVFFLSSPLQSGEGREEDWVAGSKAKEQWFVICGEGTKLDLWMCYLCSHSNSTKQAWLVPSYRKEMGGQSARMGDQPSLCCQWAVTPPYWLELRLCSFSTLCFLIIFSTENKKFRKHGFRFYFLV